ncbi:MAG: hypothetical protein ACRDO7_09235 [Nocardioidaceae bacterium]
METFLVVAAIGLAGYVAVQVARTRNATAGRDADKIRCPHCQVLGSVTVRLARRKTGVSGPRATGSFAGGASMLVAGLSGKQAVRHLACLSCGMQWDSD